MSELYLFLSSVGVSVTLSSLVIFLAKSWITERLKNSISHEYAQKLETHKAQIKAENDIYLERMKSELQIEANRHNVSFAKTYNEKMETITTTYGLLCDLNRAYSGLAQIGDFNDNINAEFISKFQEMLDDFSEYYFRRKIFIPEDINLKIVKLFCDMQEKHVMFDRSICFNRNEDYYKYNLEEAYKFAMKEIPDIQFDLEKEFRRLLGTEK